MRKSVNKQTNKGLNRLTNIQDVNNKKVINQVQNR